MPRICRAISKLKVFNEFGVGLLANARRSEVFDTCRIGGGQQALHLPECDESNKSSVDTCLLFTGQTL
jgi:hypothetical protein